MSDINVLSISPAKIKEVLNANYAIDMPTCLLGDTGIGKTQITYDFARSIGARVVEIVFGQIERGDIVIPTINNIEVDGVNETSINLVVLGELANIQEGEKVVLFLDEITAAQRDVMSYLYKLINQKSIANLKLPNSVYIVAAGNRIQDGTIATEPDAALVRRMCIVQVEPDTEDWIQYAVRKGLHPTVVAFIKNNPSSLNYNYSRKDRKLIKPTPASWEVVSDMLWSAEQTKLSPEILTCQISGMVGQELATALLVFNEELNDLIHIPNLIKLAQRATEAKNKKDDVGYSQVANQIKKILPSNQAKVLALTLHLKHHCKKDINLASYGIVALGILLEDNAELLTGSLTTILENFNHNEWVTLCQHGPTKSFVSKIVFNIPTLDDLFSSEAA